MRKDVFKLQRRRKIFCLLLLVIIPVSLMALVPQVINYQGHLTNPDGSPVADGPYQMVFTIYDTPTGNPGIWYSGSQAVNVENGQFTYQLGTVNQLADDIFTDTLRWLGIRVGEDPEITPRTKLTSVAYAYYALRADTATGVALTPTLEPGACDGDGTGTVYYDSYFNELCYCNGTNWVQVDGGGNCDCKDNDDDGYDTCDPGNPHDTDGQPADCDDGNALINPGETEICDGLDNDCNDVIDDGDPGGDDACNTGQQGICADGITHCLNGALVCEQNEEPVAEICDGLDNDCDGAVDEGDPGGGDACNTGLSGECAQGTLQCVNGTLVCNQNTQPTSEICDGLDNDCDGVADEGDPGGGGACNTGLAGECAQGTSQCVNGVLVCNQNTQPTSEICDGLDNDCDGAVDEGNPGGGGACNTGLSGECAQGTLQCVAGVLQCVQTIFPVSEICFDELDNDCDGLTDIADPDCP